MQNWLNINYHWELESFFTGSYYILHGLGDSGAGVIRETTVRGLLNRRGKTRNTILAIVQGGKPFKNMVKKTTI